MKSSLKSRLVVMFAVAAAATFALTGVALYGVLDRQLDRIQQDALRTTAHEVSYSLTRSGDPERWGRFKAKLDTLTPADGSLRFWVLSDDPAYEYGKGLPTSTGSSAMPMASARLRCRTARTNC